MDIILLGMQCDGFYWQPQDIDLLFIPDDTEENDYLVDYDVYHICCIKEKTETSKMAFLSIYFKCSYADKKFNEFYAREDWEELDKNAVFEPPYVNCGLITKSVYKEVMSLLKTKRGVISSEDPNLQGICDFFNAGFDSSSFTPDIAMFKEDDGTYHFDS